MEDLDPDTFELLFKLDCLNTEKLYHFIACRIISKNRSNT